MRDPDHQLLVNEFGEGESVITINNIPKFDIPDYDLFNDKDYKKFILDVKSMCRTSRKYRKFIGFLRANMDMNKCSFYENITNENSFKIKIEIHHDPFTIEDIIMIVARKRQECGEPMDCELVAKEVMILHYNLLVGLIPLSKTVHELVGNHYLFVPTTKVLGRYDIFAKMYDKWICPEQKDMLRRIEKATEDVNLIENQMSVLNKNYVYLNLSEHGLPRYDLIEEFIKQEAEKNNSHTNIELEMPFVRCNNE